MLYKILVSIIIAASLIGCDTVDNNNPNGGTPSKSGEWLIPSNEVFDGGPGRDGIPALENPELISVSNTTYLGEDALVLIFSHDNDVRIYPHSILDWHEIINDKIGNRSFAVTYCPLTGSGINWNRLIDGGETTFGVSGLLYNTNLIPYDRKTGSNWSQMRLQSVNGPLISTNAEVLPLVETSWKTAKQLFPNAQVVSINTGYSRSYGNYPYGDYRTNHSSLIFPVNHNDGRLNAKERVLGVIGEKRTKAYRIADFSEVKVFVDSVGTEKFLIYANYEQNLIAAFELSGLFDELTFSTTSSSLPHIIKDSNGNNYDIFGRSHKTGISDLKPAESFIAYWFAWAAFYPATELYNE